jgi:hypothetical protein
VLDCRVLCLKPLPKELAIDRKCVGMALDFLQSVEVDFPAQWKSLVPAGVDYVSGSPDIVNQFFFRFLHE